MDVCITDHLPDPNPARNESFEQTYVSARRADLSVLFCSVGETAAPSAS